ncbi:hypothetical protein IWQ56_003802, partial [Coemansia nantahalensis]
RQLACGSGVDWEQVGQAAGLDVCMCLELCRIDEGKGRWVYDPDTFSWATAKRMEAFIADNYPLPAAPNFRAVSNYLWVDIDDCIRMVDADMAAVFEQVTLKKVTHQAMAAQLGVPSQSLAIQIEKHKSKMYSGTWTDAEVAQLMEFLDKTPTPHPWEYFAKKLGTKSKLQCSTKYKSLRKTGRVAR